MSIQPSPAKPALLTLQHISIYKMYTNPAQLTSPTQNTCKSHGKPPMQNCARGVFFNSHSQCAAIQHNYRLSTAAESSPRRSTVSAFSATPSPMARLAVAAGEGALRMCKMLSPNDSNTKSSIMPPLSMANARTPHLRPPMCLLSREGMYFCKAFTYACNDLQEGVDMLHIMCDRAGASIARSQDLPG